MMNKLRLGVVGTNNITGKVITGGRQDSRFELAAVCSRKRETAESFAAKHGIPHTFDSIEKMAASSLIDAVYIASPNALHASQSIVFMEHGKHVLCEKALGSNACEVRDMFDAARRNRVSFMEAMKPTLTPNFFAARDAMKKIGKIRRYFSCYCQYSSRYDEFRNGVVQNAFRPDLSNGALVDIGVYTIYPMVVLFGRPDSVSAAGFKLSSGVDGSGSAVFSYKDMDASVLYSKIANSSLHTDIQGEEGNVVLDRINIISSVHIVSRDGSSENVSRVAENNEYFYEVKEFIDMVQSGRQESAINSWENSLITMEIMDEMRRQLGIVYPADAASHNV